MPTTYTLVGPSRTDLDLKLKEISSALRQNFVGTPTVVKDPATQWGADYIYNAGPAGDSIRLELRKNYNAKQDTTYNSIRLITAIRGNTSETGLVWDMGSACTVAWNHAGRYNPSPALQLEAIQLVASLVFKDLAGANGLPLPTVIENFDRGVLTEMFG